MGNFVSALFLTTDVDPALLFMLLACCCAVASVRVSLCLFFRSSDCWLCLFLSWMSLSSSQLPYFCYLRLRRLATVVVALVVAIAVVAPKHLLHCEPETPHYQTALNPNP